jgi:hypothetical protein
VPPKLARGITGFVNNLTQEFNEDTLMLAPLHINTNTNTISNSTEYGCDGCEIDDYELSNDITSCYATEGTLNTMRSMSQI